MDLNQSEIDNIMREVFGLQGIQDPALLKKEVQRHMASMNAIERAEINMRIGRKADEAKARAPGAMYSPQNHDLFIASIFFLVISVVLGYVIFNTNLSFVIKLIAGILGIYMALLSWRGFARIMFRLSNHRDW
jgi:hypothetical protein